MHTLNRHRISEQPVSRLNSLQPLLLFVTAAGVSSPSRWQFDILSQPDPLHVPIVCISKFNPYILCVYICPSTYRLSIECCIHIPFPRLWSMSHDIYVREAHCTNISTWWNKLLISSAYRLTHLCGISCTLIVSTINISTCHFKMEKKRHQYNFKSSLSERNENVKYSVLQILYCMEVLYALPS